MNEPKIAESELFELRQNLGILEKVGMLPAVFRHIRRFGMYSAVAELDHWSYREKLHDLDRVCLKVLKDHGALSVGEMVEWLNKGGMLQMAPDKTGINEVTMETVEDWIELARRRNYVTLLPQPGGFGTEEPRWILAEHGREAARSPLLKVASSLPAGSPTALVAGGSFLAGWLAKNELALTIAGVIAAIAAYCTALWVMTTYSNRRARPGAAVVAIETVRSAGRELPAFSSESPATVSP